MEFLTIFRSKWMVFAGMVLYMPLLGGCQEEGFPDQEGAEVSLSVIPDNEGFGSLPLIGTQWKLVGFVDEKRSTVKLAEPVGEDTYLLTLNKNGEISGRTSTNTAFGKYSLDSDLKAVVISQFNHLTKINELYDGRNYIESMNHVFSFKLFSKGLALYYEDQKYLLFSPIE